MFLPLERLLHPVDEEDGAGGGVVGGQDGGAFGDGEDAGVRRGEGDAAGGAVRLADGGADGGQGCIPRGAEYAGGGHVVERLPVEAAVGVVVGDIRVAAAGAAVAQGAAVQFLDVSAGYARPLSASRAHEGNRRAVYGLLDAHEFMAAAGWAGENDISGHKATFCQIICSKSAKKSTSFAGYRLISG